MERAPLLAPRDGDDVHSRTASASSTKSSREGHALRALIVALGAVCGLTWALFAVKFATLSAEDVAHANEGGARASLGARQAFARATLGALRRGGY